MTAKGKFVFTLLLLLVVFFGAARWWNKLNPSGGRHSTTANVPSAGCGHMAAITTSIPNGSALTAIRLADTWR